LVLTILGALSLAGGELVCAKIGLSGWAASGGGVLLALGCVGLLFTFTSWHHIRLSVAALRCVSAFLRDSPWVGLCAPLFAIIHLAGLMLWLLASLGAAVLLGSTGCSGIITKLASSLGLLICFLWGSACTTALSSFVVARVTVGWHRPSTCGKQRGPHLLVQELSIGLRYHLGSLALGSLLLALVQLLSILLSCVARKPRRERLASAPWEMHLPVPQPEPPSVVRSCQHCAAGVLEAVARWASRQAFVQVAICDCSFGEAAARATHLTMKVPVGFLTVEAMARLFHRGCEICLLCLASCAAVAFNFRGPAELVPPLLGAWLAAESLLHPYSVATTAILQCGLLSQSTDESASAPAAAKVLHQTLRTWKGSGRQSEDVLGSNFAGHYQVP